MPVTLNDAAGFAAFLLNVWGNLLLARKSETGWPVRIASILLWGAYAWSVSSLPMLANAATFFCINCYSAWKWRRERVPAEGQGAGEEGGNGG